MKKEGRFYITFLPPLKNPSNNAKGGKDCADEIFEDDGRDEDGREDRRDWGNHHDTSTPDAIDMVKNNGVIFTKK